MSKSRQGAQIKVAARWFRWRKRFYPPIDGGAIRESIGFIPDPDEDVLMLNARETPKCLKVELPSGYVQTIKIYDRFGNRQKTARVYVRSAPAFFIEFSIPQPTGE